MRMVKKRGLAEPKTAFRRAGPAPARMGNIEQRTAKKRQAVNVYVSRETLKVAREMGINLSLALERELDRLTGDERAKRFYEENKAFIDWHNEMVEKHGTMAEAYYGRDAFDDPSV
jgi:post-segregation antitoxin (ccd killing protein)